MERKNKVKNTVYNRAEALITNAKGLSKEKGLLHVAGVGAKMALSWPANLLYHHYCKNFKPQKTFMFQNKAYPYFYHKYNTTWEKERIVEIPIILKIMESYDEKNILEVGNVLSHYIPVSHDVLDKYEKASEGVMNKDVVSFKSPKKYSLIVSISTLEHVGWDETPKNPEKVLRSIDNLKKLLNPRGKLVITIPIGHNQYLDGLIDKKKIRFTKMFCLKRISADNEWIETDWNGIRCAKYGAPYNFANGLLIGIIEKK